MWLFTREMQPIHHQPSFEKPWWKRKHFQILTKKNGKFMEERKNNWGFIHLEIVRPERGWFGLYRWIFKIGSLRICRFWWKGDSWWNQKEKLTPTGE